MLKTEGSNISMEREVKTYKATEGVKVICKHCTLLLFYVLLICPYFCN